MRRVSQVLLVRSPSLLIVLSTCTGCKNDAAPSSHTDAPAPAATATAVVQEFTNLDSCSCPGLQLAYRIVREGDDTTAEPGRRHYLMPEFRISGGDKTWIFKPASECALPQRMFANTLMLGVACSANRLVIAGPHWASGFSVGRESWTRRIDGDPSLADDLLRPMLKPAGLAAPEWGPHERADLSKVSISCEKLTVDQGWVRIADWGGNASWYDITIGMQR